eukprot:1157065-Pelagomonas_calceolata.AAC.6
MEWGRAALNVMYSGTTIYRHRHKVPHAHTHSATHTAPVKQHIQALGCGGEEQADGSRVQAQHAAVWRQGLLEGT